MDIVSHVPGEHYGPDHHGGGSHLPRSVSCMALCTSCVYCVVYGGLGSTEHWVHNVCTVWCMVVWVVLNIGYMKCVLCGVWWVG